MISLEKYKIGYIGLGLMGKPCVEKLLQAKAQVAIWARKKEVLEEYSKKSVQCCSSPSDLAQQVDFLFLNVSNTADVEELLFSPQGIASTPKKGLIIIDMSTISTIKTKEFAKKMEELGMYFIDAPVSGGTAGAQNGSLSFMVGSSEENFSKILPILQHMGKKITRIGNAGAGQVAKSCNQICITANLIGVGEAMAFAKANGVDFAPIREALLGGFAASQMLDSHGLRLLQSNFEPGFKSALHRKDIGICKEVANQLGSGHFIIDKGYELLSQAVEKGYGEQDSSVFVRVMNKEEV